MRSKLAKGSRSLAMGAKISGRPATRPAAVKRSVSREHRARVVDIALAGDRDRPAEHAAGALAHPELVELVGHVREQHPPDVRTRCMLRRLRRGEVAPDACAL